MTAVEYGRHVQFRVPIAFRRWNNHCAVSELAKRQSAAWRGRNDSRDSDRKFGVCSRELHEQRVGWLVRLLYIPNQYERQHSPAARPERPYSTDLDEVGTQRK